MKPAVDRLGVAIAKDLGPQIAKPGPVRVATLGTGAMTGGIGGRLVQKEQLSITTGLQQGPGAAAKRGPAGDPAARRVVPADATLRIMQAPPVAHPAPTLRHGMKGAEGIDPVLTHLPPLEARPVLCAFRQGRVIRRPRACAGAKKGAASRGPTRAYGRS